MNSSPCPSPCLKSFKINNLAFIKKAEFNLSFFTFNNVRSSVVSRKSATSNEDSNLFLNLTFGLLDEKPQYKTSIFPSALLLLNPENVNSLLHFAFDSLDRFKTSSASKEVKSTFEQLLSRTIPIPCKFSANFFNSQIEISAANAKAVLLFFSKEIRTNFKYVPTNLVHYSLSVAELRGYSLFQQLEKPVAFGFPSPSMCEFLAVCCNGQSPQWNCCISQMPLLIQTAAAASSYDEMSVVLETHQHYQPLPQTENQKPSVDRSYLYESKREVATFEITSKVRWHDHLHIGFYLNMCFLTVTF